MFFWNSPAFSMIQQMMAIWSLIPLPFLNPAWTSGSSLLLKPGLEYFEHYFANMWDECNCAVVWTFFGIAFLSDWNENWPFPVLRPLLSFPNLLAYWMQHFHSIIFHRKSRGTRDQIANIRWIMKKAGEFQKNIYFCFIDYTKAFDCVDHNTCGKFWKRWHKHTEEDTHIQEEKHSWERDIHTHTHTHTDTHTPWGRET